MNMGVSFPLTRPVLSIRILLTSLARQATIPVESLTTARWLWMGAFFMG